MTTPPAAIVFDMGGVLSGPPFAELEDYCIELGLERHALSSYFRGDPEFSRVEVGAMDALDFFTRLPNRILNEVGVAIDPARIRDGFLAARPLLPEMLSLAEELARGHTVAIMTNNVADGEKWYTENLPTGVFAFIMNSAVIGMRKPDEAIYVELLRRLGTPPSDVVFVDDFAENLEPAKALGIKTVLFTDIADCRTQLVRLGAVLAETA